jgi:hypothetical protein
MKNLIKIIKADKIILRGFILGAILSIVTFLYIVVNYNRLPPFIPIFNQLPWGQQRFTQTPGIFITSIIFFIIFITNIVMSSVTYNKSPLLSRILAATTLLISVINLIFIVRTILVIL